jgi:hypothetical protein
VPVRVEACEADGLLAQVVRIDLVGLTKDQARTRLLQGVRERLKPGGCAYLPGCASRARRSSRLPRQCPQGVKSPCRPPRLGQARRLHFWQWTNSTTLAIESRCAASLTMKSSVA